MTPLPSSTYVSLTTFRRTGVPVSTPVWAAPDGDTLVVWTRTDSGKVKRLRHTTRVTVAPCNIRGRVEGPAVDGDAEFVTYTEWPGALAALRRTYGFRFQLGYVTSRVLQRLSRRDSDRNEIIRIRPAA
jgi:PPOX class probable F420-dependent enzyme